MHRLTILEKSQWPFFAKKAIPFMGSVNPDKENRCMILSVFSLPKNPENISEVQKYVSAVM